MLTSTGRSVEFWSKMPLSVAGRVALSKMVILPRYLYLFAALPLVIPRTFFRESESLQLIWGNVRHRVALSKLKLPTDEGGLAAPDFELYYITA